MRKISLCSYKYSLYSIGAHVHLLFREGDYAAEK